MKPLGFGVIGTGRISKNHLQSIMNLNEARVAAVSDIDETICRRAAAEYQCLGYQDYKELLKNPQVDIVNICTPSGSHARIAIDAMEAGKHVLVEKPMAMSLYEADLMIETSRRTGTKLGVVHQNRFNKAIVKVHEALVAGRFGVLTHGAAVVRWCRDDNYYLQAPWRGTWAQDGGCLMNQSIHNIDLLQWMFGPVESVFAYSATHLRNIEAEDTAVAIVRFKNGAFATIEASTVLYPKNLEETLNIFGSTGTAVVGGVAVNKLETWRFPDEDEAMALEAQFKEPPNVYGFGHMDIIKNFIKAVTNDVEPCVCGSEGRKALEIILAIYHSVRLKKEISLPLQEEFRIGVGL